MTSDNQINPPTPYTPEEPIRESACNPSEKEGCEGCTSGCGGCGGCGGCNAPRGKLFGYNWLEGISDASNFDTVEVQFKNTRRGYYLNPDHLPLKIGDMVAVEASPGHDIGQVTMVGKLVALQMRKANLKPDTELKKVFRIAREADLQKYEEARAREDDTMIRSRRIADELNLNMKIGDVEYQGDGSKAIFYYIADERVDFRKLIRVLAETFKVRIEMKQIGARQEAGRIGGIGPCGRPLCCSTWLTGFVSVGTAAARHQDLSMNPQKLAGQCAKLKCCLNFEADTYMEASSKLPPRDVTLETVDATYYHFKTDILSGKMTYSTDKSMPVNTVTITARRVKEIIALNRRGEKVESLLPEGERNAPRSEFVDLVGQDNINRFDKSKRRKKSKGNQNQQGHRNADNVSNDNNPEISNGSHGAESHSRPKKHKNHKKPKQNSGQNSGTVPSSND